MKQITLFFLEGECPTLIAIETMRLLVRKNKINEVHFHEFAD